MDENFAKLVRADQLNSQEGLCMAQATQKLFEDLYAYLHNKIACPDPHLGRSGDVCPFVGPALNQFHSMYFGAYEGELDPSPILEAMRHLIALFPTLSPIHSPGSDFKAIILTFPGLSLDGGSRLIDPLQKALKPEVTAQGLMIGQFYPGCPEPGLHNSDFRPLSTPFPILVLRPMHLTDLMFLMSSPEYFRAYCRKFGVTSREQVTMRIARANVPQLPQRWEECLDAVFPLHTLNT
jgi:hypothetical protein